jgi:hypothetical protein
LKKKIFIPETVPNPQILQAALFYLQMSFKIYNMCVTIEGIGTVLYEDNEECK